MQHLTSELSQLLEREARLLDAHNLLQAQEVSPLQFSTGARTRSELRITLPRFELPRYRAFCLLEAESLTIHPDLEENYCYVLTEAGGWTLAESERLFEAEGLPSVLERYPGGIWTNRDPWGVYKYLTGREGTGYDDKLTTPSGWGVAPLYELDDEALCRVVQELPAQLDLFASVASDLADNMFGMEIEEMSFIFHWARGTMTRPANVPGWLYRNVIEKLPVPNICRPELPRSATFKVLPDSASSVREALGFLDALRTLRQPILFSVVQEGGQVSFSITCERGSAEGVQRQLSLHYPSFTVEETDCPPAPFDDEPHSYSLRPAKPYERLRELSDIPLDPLQHLLAHLDLAPDEPTVFEVACAPVSEGATATLARFFAQWYEGHGNKEAGRRGKMISAKSPAWAVRLTLATASRGTLSPLYSTFLKPLSTYEQPFVSAEPDGAGPPLWGLVTTGELASFLHFPLFDPKRTRIESAVRRGQPPKEYTIE